MIALQVARIIANFSLFLDLTDDDTLDPDAAVQMMEELASDLKALDKDFLRELVDAFALIAPEYGGDAQALVRDIPDHFYLEDELVADDPVKLAELEARRDAEPVDGVGSGRPTIVWRPGIGRRPVTEESGLSSG